MCDKPGDWYPDHILSWYQYRDNKNVYFIFYEDMKKVFVLLDHNATAIAQWQSVGLMIERMLDAGSIPEIKRVT